MKKLIALCLALIMCLAVLAACDNSANNGKETTNNETSESTPTPGTNPETPPTSDVEYDVNAAAAYVDSLYKNSENITAADYPVVGQVMIAGVKYTVTWTVDNELVKVVAGDPYWTVDVDEKATEEHTYKITATITAGDGTTATVSYEHTVPKYVLVSFEDYMAAGEGTTVVIEGIVVAMNGKSVGNSRNHLFLADASGKGGYYCYQLDNDPVEAGVKIGMTVSVTAVVTPYSGMQETKGGTFTIVDETIKTVEPLDLTDKFAAGEDLKNYVGLPVVVKGVTLGSQDLATATSQYLYFELNGKKAYLRTYITDFPTTLEIVTGEDGAVSSPDKTTIDEDHAAHFGYTADVTGILILYSGNPYLIPVSTTPFTNYELIEKTPEEKIEAEFDDLKLDASASSDTVIDLLATGKYYDDVTFTWTTEDTTGAATIADGKLTLVVPDAETIVKVTVTATCGGVTDTKEFTIKLSKSITAIKDAIEIGAAQDHNTYTEEKYIVAGIIKEVYNTTYGNMYLVDEFGNEFTVYGTYLDGKKYGEFEGAKPVAGDYVVVLGVLGQYNDAPQMKNADIMSFTTPTTIPSVLDSVKDFEKNQYTDNKVIISGAITEVQNDKYGNVVITDAEGNSILVYGLYSANGAVRYDAMETKPVVGDTITVLGIVGKYNDAQMKNGWLIGYTAAATDPEGGDDNTEEDGPVEVTIPEALAAEDGTDVIVTGKVKEINTEWSEQYGNITVTIEDAEGNTLYIYRLKTNVKVGDVIKITGKVGSYNDAKQIAAGATAEIVEAAPVEVTIPEALAAEDGTAVIVTGTVKEINTGWSEQYGNITVTIEDAEGNTLYIYRLKTNVKVGDVIKITGKVGSYNDAKQIAAGATAEIITANA